MMKKFLKFIFKFALFLILITLAVNLAVIYLIPVSYVSFESLSNVENNIVNVLLMGTDSSGLRTDSMMIASFHLDKGKLGLLSIPRDVKVDFPKGRTNKLNAVYGISDKNPKDTIRFIEDFTGLSIHYYLVTMPETFREFIDAIGGVEYNVPVDMKYSDPVQDLYIDLKKGKQILNGDKAEQLTRFRGYANADLERISVQRDFLKVMLSQNVNIGNILKSGMIYSKIKPTIRTNIQLTALPLLLKLFYKIDRDSISSLEAVTSQQVIDGIFYLNLEKEKTKKLISKELYADNGSN